MFRVWKLNSPSKVLRVSQFRWAVHELFVASRTAVQKGATPEEVQSQLATAISKQNRMLMKFAVAFLVSSIFVAQPSEDASVTISAGFIKVSLPAIYVAFVISACFALLILASLKVLTLITIRAALPYTSFARARFAEAGLAVKGDADHYDVILPIRGGSYFRAAGLVTPALISTIFIVILLLLLPLLAALPMLWSVTKTSILSHSDIYLSRSLGIASLALLVLPLIVAILFFIPSAVRKNELSIRWSFLIHATRDGRRIHPQSNRWSKP